MTPNNDKISSTQVGVFIFNTILGVGILTLPASLVQEVGTDAWLLAIISGIVNIFFIYLICKVGVRFGEKGFVGTLRSLFGRLLGTILAIPVLIYFVGFAGLEVRIFAETLKVFLLNNTPIEYIIISLLILAIFLARSGIEPTARFFEAVTPVIIVIMVGLTLLSFPSNKGITNLRPYLTTPILKYVKGLKAGIFAYGGFEVLLILFPFIRKPKEAFKASLIPHIVIIVLYTIIIIECLAKFGTKETEALIYPTMTLIKSVEIPGGFIERMEGLLIALWVLFVFTTIVALIYAYSVIGGDLLNHKERKHIIALFLPAMYLIALAGNNIAELFDLIDRMTIVLGSYTAIILPTIMFIMMKLKGKNSKQSRSEGGEKSET